LLAEHRIGAVGSCAATQKAGRKKKTVATGRGFTRGGAAAGGTVIPSPTPPAKTSGEGEMTTKIMVMNTTMDPPSPMNVDAAEETEYQE